MDATRTAARPGRGAMLEAAVTLFHARGFHGTSMRDIAAAAGVTVGASYHHFASKQAILTEIMTGAIGETLAMTRAALAEAPAEPAAQLTALVRAWMLFHTTRQRHALVGASELRSLDAEGRRSVVALRDEQEAMFRVVVEHGVQEGVFATRYPREAARAVINMGYSVSSWYRLGGDIGPEEMADRYCDLALGTVRARS